ncbi:MAG: hypothetical protein Q9159_005206 [Coniocarpon cinnabarinum]
MEYPTRQSKSTRTLIQALDLWLKVKPDKIWACLPESSNIADGLRYVTMREVACAIDSFAWAMKEEYGTSSDFETIAYTGVNDLRYAVVFYAAIKCGYKTHYVKKASDEPPQTLMLSPKNTPQQNAILFETTQCRKFFLSPELASVGKAVQALVPGMTLQVVEDFDHWLDSYTRHFPFERSFEEGKWDPILVLHSSGSTGPPKAVTINNGYMAASHAYMQPPPGRHLSGMLAFDFDGGGAFFAPFPCCHLAGFQATCVLPVYAVEASAIFALPDRPATAQLAKQIMEQQPVRGTYAPPSIIEQISALPGGMELLVQQEVMIYAGGPLSRACGDRLVKHGVKVATIFGSTETGPNKTLIPLPEDWAYLEFHPHWGNDMQLIMDGAYELVFHNDEPEASRRGIYWTHPHLQEYRTKDMFMRHPTKPGLWTFYARNDDIIIFSNGEKWNPLNSEGIILNSPRVSGVLIFGDNRQQPAALIEPKDEVENAEAFLEELWPTIETANAQSQRQGLLLRSKIGLVEPAGLVRAAKGTVVRRLSLEKYSNLVETLYGEGMNGDCYAGPTLGDFGSLRENLQVFIRDCARMLSPLSHDTFNDEDDFYVNGLDSVQTVEFTRMLKAGLKPKYGDLRWLTGQTIFDFPCVANLADALETFITQEQPSGDDASHAAVAAVESMIARYISAMELADGAIPRQHPQPGQIAIALTGSTGSLGMRIVQSLISSPQIRHVFCLDRTDNARSRIQAAMPALAIPDYKVTFLQTAFGEPQLGFSADLYQILTQQVDAIIHNAWKVDFNHSLSSFEPVHIRGVANFIRFSQISPRRPRIMFVSSIASVGNYHEPRNQWEPVPEEILVNPNVAQQMGYGQSKYVAERILAAAPTKAGVPISILRSGQIAGPVGIFPEAMGPAWNRSEWLPSIIETSRNLGCIPGDMSEVDWVPVDVLGKVIVDDLLIRDILSESCPASTVYNLSNPRLAPWYALMDTVQARLGGPRNVPIVPWHDWFNRVKQFDVNNELALTRYPVLKMLRFFEVVERHDGKSRLATKKTVAASPTMQALQPIHPDWMALWLDQWGYVEDTSMHGA